MNNVPNKYGETKQRDSVDSPNSKNQFENNKL